MNKIIDIIEKLHQEYIFSFILYYIKVHCVQAPLEAFMGLFLFIWLMICINPDLLSDDLFIKIPLSIMLIVCFVYLCIINGVFIYKLYVLREACGKDNYILYNIFESVFKRLSIFIHILGASCYFSVTFAILIVFEENFDIITRIFLICVGSIVGVIWNIRGYWGDMRIDWRKICKGEKIFLYEPLEDIEKVRRLKLKYTVKHITINIITIVAMFLIYLGLVIQSFDNSSLLGVIVDLSAEKIGTYGFFVVAFLLALIFYIRTLYPIFYIQKASIYYQFCDLFNSP